jgi:hypothetical protein
MRALNQRRLGGLSPHLRTPTSRSHRTLTARTYAAEASLAPPASVWVAQHDHSAAMLQRCYGMSALHLKKREGGGAQQRRNTGRSDLDRLRDWHDGGRVQAAAGLPLARGQAGAGVAEGPVSRPRARWEQGARFPVTTPRRVITIRSANMEAPPRAPFAACVLRPDPLNLLGCRGGTRHSPTPALS